MRTPLTINKRGVITLPAKLRQALGLKADDQLIADYRIYQAGGDFDVSSNAAYVQDSWAVTPNLTFNIGVRFYLD